jgi:phosphoglycerate kinase
VSLRTLDSLGDLAGKRVILRCDFNVPVKDGVVTDDGRIRAALPTIRALIDHGAKVIAISHLGRPDGSPEERYRLAPAAVRLAELLGTPVALAQDTVGESAERTVASLEDGSVAVLENLRFEPGETSKNADDRWEFAEQLARFGDAMVSDGFGVVHRKQASVFELAQILPSAAGLLISSEIDVLERLTERPERPYTVVLGGSKVSDKLGVIAHLLPRVDRILVGGGMLFTFLKALGHPVGASLLEEDQLDTVRGYLTDAEKRGVQIVLPTDVVVADRFAADATATVLPADGIESGPAGASGLGLDIGPQTAEHFASLVESSATVFWNGPMGVFEFPAFAHGTRSIATALSRVSGLGVVGGGDSAAAVRALGFTDDDFGHVSTGGGASLEFLEGRTLPGLEVLGWA